MYKCRMCQRDTLSVPAHAVPWRRCTSTPLPVTLGPPTCTPCAAHLSSILRVRHHRHNAQHPSPYAAHLTAVTPPPPCGSDGPHPPGALLGPPRLLPSTGCGHPTSMAEGRTHGLASDPPERSPASSVGRSAARRRPLTATSIPEVTWAATGENQGRAAHLPHPDTLHMDTRRTPGETPQVATRLAPPCDLPAALLSLRLLAPLTDATHMPGNLSKRGTQNPSPRMPPCPLRDDGPRQA